VVHRQSRGARRLAGAPPRGGALKAFWALFLGVHAENTAAAPPIRGPRPAHASAEVIHNLWIRLKKRSKAIERTCLVEGDRPYSPSLDGGLQRRQSTAGRKASRSHSDGRRRKLRTQTRKVGGSLFNRNTERKESRKVPKKSLDTRGNRN
jgi:hypothetical protein